MSKLNVDYLDKQLIVVKNSTTAKHFLSKYSLARLIIATSEHDLIFPTPYFTKNNKRGYFEIICNFASQFKEA